MPSSNTWPRSTALSKPRSSRWNRRTTTLGSSIVGNHPTVLIFRDFGTPEQQKEFIPGALDRSRTVAFGLTEPEHGSDATHMETRAVAEDRDGRKGWRIDGEKMWTTGMHIATH